MSEKYWSDLLFQFLPFIFIFVIIFVIRKRSFGGYITRQEEMLQVLKEIRDILKNK